jgi:hypothetical protein
MSKCFKFGKIGLGINRMEMQGLEAKWLARPVLAIYSRGQVLSPQHQQPKVCQMPKVENSSSQ